MNAVLILPARDEEACIGQVVHEARQHFAGTIIVVDNGSKDATARVATEAGAIVVPAHEAGYGRACMAGVAAAPEADIFVFMDADGSDCPEDIPSLLAAIENGADLALGVRGGTQVEPGSIAPAARFGNWLCGTGIGVVWGRRLRDLSPLKAVRASTLRRLALQEQTYGWTVELLAKAVASHVAISEIETGYRHRAGGQSKVSGTLSGSAKAGYRILLVLGRVIVNRMQPGKVGAIAGAALSLLALVAYTAWLFAQGPSSQGVLVSAWLLAWPLLLAGILTGGAAGMLIGRRNRRPT